jgi:hypothetical protein
LDREGVKRGFIWMEMGEEVGEVEGEDKNVDELVK